MTISISSHADGTSASQYQHHQPNPSAYTSHTKIGIRSSHTTSPFKSSIVSCKIALSSTIYDPCSDSEDDYTTLRHQSQVTVQHFRWWVHPHHRHNLMIATSPPTYISTYPWRHTPLNKHHSPIRSTKSSIIHPLTEQPADHLNSNQPPHQSSRYAFAVSYFSKI